jgi:hypothetical protein
MKWRLVGALLLAFWPLSQPALADVRQDGNLIQFSYSWGRVEQSFTDSIVTVTVTNNITNKIGGNGEIIDTYRISLGAEVIQKTEKHDAVDYTFTITGSQTLVLEGIDNGFWAGYYGPIMTVTSEPLTPAVEPITESPTVSATVSETVTESATVSEPVTVSPILWDFVTDENSELYAQAPSGQVFSGVVARYVSKETECGLDVSEIVAAALVGTSSGTIPATNDLFGDPCPGEYKKLLVSVQYAPAMITAPSTSEVVQSASPTISPEPTPTPTPEPQPTPEPSPSPEPAQPQPTPTEEPSPEPTATVPSQSPTPEPTPMPTASAETPTESAEPTVPPALPSTSPEAQPQPIISPTPVQSSEPPYEEPTVPATQAPEVSEETESETVSGTIEAAFTETIGAAVEAVGELVEAFQSAGLDMTPEQREEAQDVVISTIIVSQVATTASAAAVSARKIK